MFRKVAWSSGPLTKNKNKKKQKTNQKPTQYIWEQLPNYTELSTATISTTKNVKVLRLH